MNSEPTKDDALSSVLSRLHEISRVLEEERTKHSNQVEDLWNSMSHQEQQDCFYAVVKRIHKAEVVDGGSYRYALYDVFGWGPEAYGMGMDCGYMDLHNRIWGQWELKNLCDSMAKEFDLDSNKLWDWMVRNHHV